MSTANLDALPIDIKVIILNFLPNLRTLDCLCQAFPTYKKVHKTYRRIIDSNILYSDAVDNYARESIWLASYHGELYDPKSGRESLKIALEAMLEYILFPNSVPENIRITGDEDDNDTWHEVMAEAQRVQSEITHEPRERDKVDAQSIIRNHRAIMGTYELLVTSKLKLQKPQQASAEEEHRIVTAIYRFFIAINLKASMPDDHQPPFEEVFKIWGFWGVVAVRAVRDFFEEQITKMEENFSAVPDGLSSRRARSGKVVKSNAVSKPVLPACVIALHEFPDNFLTWINPTGYFRHAAHLNTRITSMLNSMRRNNIYKDRDPPIDEPARWGEFSLYFAHLHIWARQADDDSGKVENHDYRLRSGEELPVQKSRPRNGNKNGLISTLEIQTRDSAGQTKSPLDPLVAFWDLWRLEKLGYQHCNWRLKRSMSWEYDDWDREQELEWSQDIYSFNNNQFFVPLTEDGSCFVDLDTYLHRLRQDSYGSDDDAERMSLFKTPKKRGRNGKPMKERRNAASISDSE
ncbi:hypothetical protein TWF281_001424 [Arthrobotrys megalospora]